MEFSHITFQQNWNVWLTHDNNHRRKKILYLTWTASAKVLTPTSIALRPSTPNLISLLMKRWAPTLLLLRDATRRPACNPVRSMFKNIGVCFMDLWLWFVWWNFIFSWKVAKQIVLCEWKFCGPSLHEENFRRGKKRKVWRMRTRSKSQKQGEPHFLWFFSRVSTSFIVIVALSCLLCFHIFSLVQKRIIPSKFQIPN